MKKILGLTLLFVVMGFGVYTGASAAVTGPLTCFDGPSDSTIYGGDCTITAGTATLDNSGGDSDGSYSGVYYPNDTLKGILLSDVDALSFDYTGTSTAGSPRISMPIDTNNDGNVDFYTFISAFYCSDGAGNVDPLTDSTCTIWNGGISYANWAAFLAAYPTAKVANAPTFVIADDAGSWTVSNVVIGDAATTASLSAEDFGVVDYNTGATGQLSGYTAGFGLTDATLAGAQSVVVKLYSGSTLLQTNTAIISKFNADITGTQFSSPFDVSGTFNYPLDGYWTNVRETQYGQSLPATRVVATVTLQNGDVVTAENTVLTGDPTTIYPENPPVTTPTTKDQCKNGGWMTFTNPSFKNQGQCVSSVASHK